MEINKKTSVVTRLVNAPSEKSELKNLSVLKPFEIEEAVIIPQLITKPSLMDTMRIIENLHIKTRQRNRLDVYADLLKEFVIDLNAQDLGDKSNYNACSLVIKDDQRRDFELKNPIIINEVVDFLKARFESKRAEIEAEIVLP